MSIIISKTDFTMTNRFCSISIWTNRKTRELHGYKVIFAFLTSRINWDHQSSKAEDVFLSWPHEESILDPFTDFLDWVFKTYSKKK